MWTSHEILSAYHILLTCTFGISVVMIILLLYIVMTQSSRLEEYRFYIINNLLWAFLLELILFVVRPVCLFPDALVYFDGPLRSIPLQAVKITTFIFFLVVVNAICGILMTLSFRYGQLLNFHITTAVKKIFWPLVVLGHMFAHVGVFYPILTISTDEHILNRVLTNSSHDLKSLIAQNSTPAMFTFFAVNSFWFLLYFSYFIAILYLSAMVVVFIHMKYLVNSKENRVFSFTFQLQNMLLTAYAADTFTSVAFVIIPFAAIVVSASPLAVPQPSLIAFIAIFMIAVYPVILCPTIIYFVKPYRRWFTYSIMKMILKLPFTCGISEASLESHATGGRKRVANVCHNVINFAYIVEAPMGLTEVIPPIPQRNIQSNRVDPLVFESNV